MNRFWAARFKAAGLKYTKPKIQLTTSGNSVCGKIYYTGAHYCQDQRTFAINITKRELRNPYRLAFVRTVAHEMGHHAQKLSGMLDTYNRMVWRAGQNTPTYYALSRRLEMQADCFAGVFFSASFDSLNGELGWDEWVGAIASAKSDKLHGSSANLARWHDRGYRNGSLAACNTWTASSSSVR